MVLRTATDSDFEALFGMPAPAEWFGLAAATDWLVLGLGLIYRARDQRWWLGLHRVPGVTRTLTTHKAALRLLEEADARNVKVHAMADPSYPNSALWIARLGFHETDETIGGIHVWTR